MSNLSQISSRTTTWHWIELCTFAVFATASVTLAGKPSGKLRVQVMPNEAARRVDVTVDGKPFTSYVWPERLTKPVLYPIRSAKGTPVTRGWPLDPRPRERVDHPHQVGLWFTYENVNGVDFWGNSDALKPEVAAKKGAIAHRHIVSAMSGPGRGTLMTDMDWILPGGKTVLHERAEFVFCGDATSRMIQQTTTLTALDEPVVFADAKDGLFGMRVTRELEQPVPATWLALHTDADGRVSAEKTVDNDGVTGSYTSSEGKHGDDVWGTRGRWVMLSGRVGDEPITIAMIDHPKNPGYPTYWHARGYGLFAANPLGAKAFSNGRDAMNFTIAPHASTTFRYRVLILEGAASPDRIEKEFMDFSKVRTHRRGPRITRYRGLQ